jgi:hypothetical protein
LVNAKKKNRREIMEKVYEVYIDISLEKDLMMVKAKNLTGALQETKKS